MLDDDCLPDEPDFIQKHVDRLTVPVSTTAWRSTVGGVTPRGVPYYHVSKDIDIVLNHGLWSNVPDYDAVTQLMSARIKIEPVMVNQVIPRDKYFPMCGMNVAFKREIAPLMYMMLMGKDYEYDRFDDIWCGLFMKKICDHLNLGVYLGGPIIRHDRASNVWNNLRKESSGIEVNETLWSVIDGVKLESRTPKDCYIELAYKLPLGTDYFKKLKEAMVKWAGLVNE